MSEHSTPEERTEMPSDKRMGQLRKEGAIFSSQDVISVATLITGFIVLSKSWESLVGDMKRILVTTFLLIGEKEPLTTSRLYDGFVGLLLLVGPNVMLIIGITAVVATLVTMLQTKWNVKEKKIKFNFKGMNPLTGIKRIFSINGTVSTGKALLKLCLILPIGFFALKNFAPAMLQLPFMSIEGILAFTGGAISTIFWKIAYVLIALAVFDYFWGKHRWLKENKMTKEEVKDERKAVDGDEATKRKIISKGLQRIAQRLAQTVPQADVIITNPTHFAVALKYERGKMGAPIVVAKGQDYLALKIREIAKENKVPIVERKALARALYASTKVGAEVPNELFRAVAEVLAYVYRLKTPARRQSISAARTQ